MLAAEGGDPVAGQLGTYTWAGRRIGRPWLPGAPIAVGAGEPLTVTVDPAVADRLVVGALVPAAARRPGRRRVTRRGRGHPGASRPGSGRLDGRGPASGSPTASGDASYFWRLTVDVTADAAPR